MDSEKRKTWDVELTPRLSLELFIAVTVIVVILFVHNMIVDNEGDDCGDIPRIVVTATREVINQN